MNKEIRIAIIRDEIERHKQFSFQAEVRVRVAEKMKDDMELSHHKQLIEKHEEAILHLESMIKDVENENV